MGLRAPATGRGNTFLAFSARAADQQCVNSDTGFVSSHLEVQQEQH